MSRGNHREQAKLPALVHISPGFAEAARRHKVLLHRSPRPVDTQPRAYVAAHSWAIYDKADLCSPSRLPSLAQLRSAKSQGATSLARQNGSKLHRSVESAEKLDRLRWFIRVRPMAAKFCAPLGHIPMRFSTKPSMYQTHSLPQQHPPEKLSVKAREEGLSLPIIQA